MSSKCGLGKVVELLDKLNEVSVESSETKSGPFSELVKFCEWGESYETEDGAETKDRSEMAESLGLFYRQVSESGRTKKWASE